MGEFLPTFLRQVEECWVNTKYAHCGLLRMQKLCLVQKFPDLRIAGGWFSIKTVCVCICVCVFVRKNHFVFLLCLLLQLLEMLGLDWSLVWINILMVSFHLLLTELIFCSFSTIAHLFVFLLFFQSESQEQVFLRWTSGETATMHILVVHAMVILLTLGPPQGW